MKGVRSANIKDVNSMSYIHAQTWKTAYKKYISAEYLDNITDDGWVPLFTRAFADRIHEAAVYEIDGINTGCVTYGKGRPMSTCATSVIGSNESNVIGCDTARSLADGNTCSDEEGEIISLYVFPEYWSTKQGYELTKFAVERLKESGYKSCYLWVIKENERAVNFYKRFGFKSTKELTAVVLAGQMVVEEKFRFDF